jgi:hypothetical protein
MKARLGATLLIMALAFVLPAFAEEAATSTDAAPTTPAVVKPAETKPPAAPVASPFQIKVGEATVRFGVLLQPQADFLQQPAGGYGQNLMIRRARFLIGGQVTKTIFFFFETENSRLGSAGAATAKVMSTGFQTLDAVAEWRPKKALNIAGGLIRVPTSRDALESASNEFTIDFNSYAFTATGALSGTGGRDTGIQARGYFLDDRFEYRAAVLSGFREAGNRNGFRTIGRVQYNFFDKEVYGFPSYAGSNFGAKKILAVGAAYDTQLDYSGVTADVFADIPVSFGSALGTLSWQSLDGGKKITALPKSDIITADAGLYFKNLKAGTWARYEQREFSVTNDKESRILVGVNYYPFGNNFNVKAGIGRFSPRVGEDMNQFTLQFQAYYY